MPFRAFDDSDGICGDFPEEAVQMPVLMPFRAFDDSDQSMVSESLRRPHVLMPFRAFDDSDYMIRVRKVFKNDLS